MAKSTSERREIYFSKYTPVPDSEQEIPEKLFMN